MKVKLLLLAAVLALPLQLVTAADMDTFSGKVAETMNAGGYTYVLVNTGSNKLWAASTQFEVKTGDTVVVSSAMPMANFHSKTLNRDFETIYFTGSIAVNGAGQAAAVLPPGHPSVTGTGTAALPAGHPTMGGQAPAPKVDLTGIKRADGGKTISEIIDAKSKLAGKSVTVRAKVVKYNGDIMGKNWLHLQDGTGSAEKNNNDLTVTTAGSAKVGDTVLVTGVVSLNKDFGAGYKYSVLLDDAKVTVE